MPSGYTLANISPSVILRQNKSLVKSFGLTELGLFRPGIVCQLQVKLPKLLKKQKTVVGKLTDQLEDTIELDSSAGTAFKITFVAGGGR